MKNSVLKFPHFLRLFLGFFFYLNQTFAQFESMPHHAEFLEKQKIECSKSASKRWDSQRNTCVTLKEASDRRDKIRSCDDENRYPTKEAKKRCYDEVAQEETGVRQGQGDDSGIGMIAVSTATAALSAVMMFSSESLKSSCASRNIFAATSAAGLAAELFYVRSAKKKLEDLQKDYVRQSSSEQEYQSQKKAFEFLKEEQLAIKDFEEKRRNALYIMTAGYAAAGVVAAIEGKTKMGAPCDVPEPKPSQTPDPDPAKSAAVDGRGANTPGPDPRAQVAKAQTQKVAKAAGISLNSPFTVALSSGIAGGLSMMLAQSAARQVERSEKNAKAVQEIIDQFESDFSQFCPNGRDDLKEPNCYCYNVDGSENSQRSNSNICLALWAKNKKSLFVEAGRYEQAQTRKERKGCAFINGQFDEDCRCRQMKNPQGQNACLRVGVPGGVLGQIGQMTTLPTAIGNLNNLAQGALGTGEFNPLGLSQNAQALSANARRALEQAFSEQSQGKQLPSTDEIVQAGLGRIPAKVLQNLAANSPGAAALAAQGRPQNAALKAAMEKAKISTEDLGDISYASAQQRPSSQASAADQEQFFDDWGTSDSSAGEGNILSFMEKNYEYKGKDIVERDDVSLWQIISNRYTQSGLRRLFGEEGEL